MGSGPPEVRKTTARAAKPRATAEQRAIGDKVITLRSDGKSFSAIAKAVGLQRSRDAFAVFVDAVALRPSSERTRLRAEENGRLDTLERRTRRDTEATDLERKLAAIVQLRERLAAS